MSSTWLQALESFLKFHTEIIFVIYFILLNFKYFKTLFLKFNSGYFIEKLAFMGDLSESSNVLPV